MILDLIEHAKKSDSPLARDYAEAAEKEWKAMTGTAGSLELALEFYADPRNYSNRGGYVSPIHSDMGDKARRALDLARHRRREQILHELGY